MKSTINIFPRTCFIVLVVSSLMIGAKLDGVAYYKLVSITLCLVTIVLIDLIKSRYSYALVILIVFWGILLLLHINLSNLAFLNRVLLGYPERNLGLYAFLIFILASYLGVTKSKSWEYFGALSSITSLIIAMSILITKLFEGSPFILSQFSYPKEGSINSNITSVYLLIGFLNIVSLSSNKSYLARIKPRVLLILCSVLIFMAIVILGNFLPIFLVLLSGFSIMLFIKLHSIKLALLKFIYLLVIPFFLISYVLLFLNLELKHFTSDLSTIERQAIARIAIKAIIDSPIVFNFPDSIADFELGQLYRPDSNLIIDNTHNFWFDFALIYGAPVAIISLVITSLCAMIYILKKFESCNSRANDLFKVTLLLNLYILSFFTIFHPITVLIYGCLFGCFVKELGPYLSQVSQNIRLVKPLLSLEYAKLKFAFFLPKNFLYNWFIRCLLIVFLSLQIFFLISNVNFRVEYQRSELTIFQKDQDLSRSLNLLSELALQNNDRKYLDYTGRQLANIVIAETAPPLRVDSTNSSLADFSCSLILQILKKQEVLEFTDRNSVYLKSWYEISCSSFD